MTIADLNQESRDLVDADTNSITAATLLRRINIAYEELVGFIIGLDGLWQFDDTNYTDFPIGVTTLVNSQQDYTFDDTYLEIEGISVLNADGNFQKLKPFDKSNISVDPAEYFEADGMPLYYDKQGRSALLYPAPDNGVSVTLASGLKIFYKRTSDNFTSAQVSTGTKVPGFASPYHVILAYMAALPYAAAYLPARVPFLTREIERIKKNIAKHYGRRELDRRKVMSMRGVFHR